jgi:hypothetical protein
VLRSRGRLIVTLDNPFNPLYHLVRGISRFRWAPFQLGYTTSQSGLAKALADAGLQVIGAGTLIHNPRLISTLLFLVLRRLMGSHADGPIRVLLRMFAVLGRLPTRRLTACFIGVYAEKPASCDPS